MEKIQVIQSLLETMLGMVLGATLLCLIYSYQPMTYNKKAIRVAGKEYVREVTRWAGHVYGNNIPVYKG